METNNTREEEKEHINTEICLQVWLVRQPPVASEMHPGSSRGPLETDLYADWHF